MIPGKLPQYCLGLTLGVIFSTAAMATEGSPAGRPEMRAFELQSAPSLDGDVLLDSAWRGVIPASDFWQVQPDEGQPATQETEVYIGFLDDSLYIGVVAYDDDPDGIIVTDARRDSGLNDSDSFRVIIDGQLDRQNGFLFGTNPLGMEYDAQVVKEGSSDAGYNQNWDASWSVQARISDIGWSAEMRIPFRTLRHGTGREQTWGINFQRNIRRNNEVVYWAPLTIQHSLGRVSEAGTVTGIRPPESRNLKFTPYGLASVQRGGELDGTETETEFGFDAKYSITPSLTLDVTYNTDFAQVEADDQQVNLDRFNLFFPEKRPFFLENSGQFSVGNNQEAQLFFSRRIGIGEDGDVVPVDGGVRLSGKIGDRTNVGLLYMSSESVEGIAPGNEFTVARINQEWGNHSSVGAIFVGRDGDGSYLVAEPDDYNRTYGIDGRLGIGDNTLITAWAAQTDTRGLVGDDHAYSLKANFDSAEWSHGIEYTEVGENFNPEVGFMSREGYRKFATNSLKRIRPEDFYGLMEIRPHYSYRGYWDFDDFQETSFLHLDVHWEWKSGYELHTGYNIFSDGIKEEFDIINDVWVQPGTYDGSEVALYFTTDQSASFSFSLRSNTGERFGGDFVSFSPNLNYRFGDRFSSSLSVKYTDFDLPVEGGDFSVTLAKLRLSYSFTPKILLQALLQYNDQDDEFGTNVRFSWLRSANTGLYLVYNEVEERYTGAPPTGREIILKYSYMFDIFN